MLTIAAGLTIHLFVTLPLLLLLLGRINPRIHFRNMIEPLATAFSTSSSGATLPVTLHAVEKKVGVSNKVSSFVLPMGATVNMDGTALYECAGVLFIAQVLGADLSLGAQIVVVITALLASIGAAAVPSAGLVIIFLVLEAVGLRGPEVEPDRRRHAGDRPAPRHVPHGGQRLLRLLRRGDHRPLRGRGRGRQGVIR